MVGSSKLRTAFVLSTGLLAGYLAASARLNPLLALFAAVHKVLGRIP
jgi:hypothetical protein